MASSAPSELRSVIEDLSVKRSGDHLRFQAKISDAQIASLMRQTGGMLGGGF